MAPLLTLIAFSVLARIAGWLGVTALDALAPSVAVGLAAMFLLTGVAHFHPKRRPGMVLMVPTRLPRPDVLVTISGIAEFAGAAGLLVPATRPLAAGCLAVLLVVMFPANWRAQTTFADTPLVSMPLWARTAVQVVFIAACLIVVRG